MALKPQDVYVTLKIVAAKSRRAPYSRLAMELVMSPSEVHASVKRAQLAHLLHGPKLHNRPNLAALEEFLVHGLKYIFPPERGELTRGVPTSYAAEPLRCIIVQRNEPAPVWPYDEGKQRGYIRPRPSRRCATRRSTNTSHWPMPFAMAAFVNENMLMRKSCTAGFGKRMNDPNLDQFIAAARLLRPLPNELVLLEDA
jgi:hypothetical protein